MSTSPETRYCFRFAPREDGSVDVWLLLCVDDPTGRSPLGWFTAANTVELGPLNVSDDEALKALQNLETAIELIAAADKKRRAREPATLEHASNESSPAGEDLCAEPSNLARPSELRLRR
jgi:hypothetical protein